MARELTFGDLHKDIIKIALNKVNKDNKILDIGCGYGAFLEKLYHNGFSNLYGVDGFIDPEFKKMLFKKAKFTEKLPFSDDEFDTIFCTEVIEHVEDQFFLINEQIRTLKIGGSLYITSPNIYSIISKISFLLTDRLAYFYDSDVKFTICPGHLTPFFISIIQQYFDETLHLKSTYYSQFVLPFTGGKIRLPLRNKLFGNIAIYEFEKIK
ncbi:class I SAM-dependent methyltransferase [Candidatus Gracilibacteria bacterium]|nr:class I SAM-dependent methyltransferase [Candidatus Gracilibacteria bacterium]